MTLMHSTVIMVTRNEKIIMKIIIMTSCKIRRNKGSHSSQSLVLYENCHSGIDLVTVPVENAKTAQFKRENSLSHFGILWILIHVSQPFWTFFATPV